MKTNNQKALLKHFSSVLRKKAIGKKEENLSINPVILKFLSRKELIQIISDKYNGTIPKEFNLIELENEELLNIIQNEMYIITYVTQKWSEEESVIKPNPANKDIIDNIDISITKAIKKEPKVNTKKGASDISKPVKKK